MSSILTRFFTPFRGNLVGKDQQGNRYYSAKRSSKMIGSVMKHRRWVLYNGPAEPTRIPPEWHAWLHHIVDEIPNDDNIKKHSWQKEHEPNQTGTINAYKPSDTTQTAQKREAYDAWSPE